MPAVDETVERIIALANANDHPRREAVGSRSHCGGQSSSSSCTGKARTPTSWINHHGRGEGDSAWHLMSPSGRLAVSAVLLARARSAAGSPLQPPYERANRGLSLRAHSAGRARSNIAAAPFQVDLLAPLKLHKMAKPRTVRSDCVGVVGPFALRAQGRCCRVSAEARCCTYRLPRQSAFNERSCT
jgi:hypothetical protein